METLVVVAQHRNQYQSRGNRTHGSPHFGSVVSPLREINCRVFESGTGLLPTPWKASSPPITKHSFSPFLSPRTPSQLQYEQNEQTKRTVKSSAVTIPINPKKIDLCREFGSFGDEFFYSELWAGPAYSNSPPPSSLPMPKFSIKPKRTVSLDLPALSASGIAAQPFAKSAPPSPRREHGIFNHRDLLHRDCSATMALRRILNLDTSD